MRKSKIKFLSLWYEKEVEYNTKVSFVDINSRIYLFNINV